MAARHFIIGLVAGIAALAIGVPLAGAGDRIVDDYFRDAQPQNTLVDDYFRDAQPQNTLVDDYFRDPQAQSTQVDDYFRDGPTAIGTGTAFAWRDFGLGAAVAVGAILVLAGLGATALAARQNRREKPRAAGTA